MNSDDQKTEVILKGIAASPGISHGKVFKFIIPKLDIPRYDIDEEQIETEIIRFEQGLIETRRQITEIRSEVAEKLGDEESRIFDAHLLVLEDAALLEETIRELERSKSNIEHCFHTVSERYVEAFGKMDDDYIKERVNDIKDVSRRVIDTLLGNNPLSLKQIKDNRIIVAEDLPPSQTASMNKDNVLGIVTDTGSRTSHAVIMARSLQVPAVVGLHDASPRLSQDDYILIDGYEGLIIINPSESTLFTYGQYQHERLNIQKVFETTIGLPSETSDGRGIELMANIGSADDISNVVKFQMDGVGLFRTESIFLSKGKFPSEEEQYLAYREVVEGLSPLSVTIRTLDIGGDKKMRQFELVHKEDNPFMGLRAIRFCLEHRELFKDQLRAIMRAAYHGNVKIMYPMVSDINEIIEANKVLEEAKEELRQRGVEFNPNLEVGIMIETPSAAWISDLLAKHCSFFSIGTNDLIQYTLAVDRVNDRIAHLYEPSHLSVLRSIKIIIENARKNKIDVGVCGEMATDPMYLPLLLGFGATSISITSSANPEIKYYLQNMKSKAAKKLAKQVMQQTDTISVNRLLTSFYNEHVNKSLSSELSGS